MTLRTTLSTALLLLCLSGCRSEPLVIDDTSGISGDDTEGDDTGNDATDMDGDGWTAEEDCDDTDAAIHPGAAEVCDELDNNCDGEIDEGVTSTWYGDADGDRAGDPSVSMEACEQPDGYTADQGDCDDTDPTTYEGASERCDGVDNDCDGEVDEDLLTTWYGDADGDGYGDADTTIEDCNPPEGSSDNALDCDDDNANAWPGNIEVCDEADNNCDGQVDEGTETTFYQDADGDGYGSSVETEACDQPSGYAATDDDCDDADGDVNPGATELCNDKDDNCDGYIDEDDAADAGTWYIDVDGDTYGSTSYTWTQCEQPSGTSDNSSDCDDLDAEIHPGADEYCDEIDRDCDGSTDDNDALDRETWYADSDGDGYGDATSSSESCEEPSGYTEDTTDCDDTDASVHPYASETPGDGVDSNCDGQDGCQDINCDGYNDLVFAEYFSGSSFSTTSYIYPYDTSVGGYTDGNRYGLLTTGALRSAAEDFDQDGYIDLLFTGYDGTSNTESTLHWGSATGYSSSNTTSLGISGGHALGLGDINGDGHVDVVIGTYYNGSYSADAMVFYGTSTGPDGSNYDEMSSAGVVELAVEDLNGDGYDDVVLCSYFNGSSHTTESSVHYGSASGLSGNTDTLSTYGCYDLEVEDFNNDGYLDIAIANYPTTTSYLYWGTASGYSSSYRDSFTTAYSGGVESADLDGDGYTDLVFGGYAGNTYVYWNSSLGFSNSVYTDLGAAYGTWGLDIADLDSDGYPEIVTAVYHDGSSHITESVIFWGSANGPSDSDITELETVGPQHVTIGDLDQDGYPEIIYPGYYTGSWGTLAESYVYWGSSTGYDNSDRDTLSTAGSWGKPLMVGDTSW